MLIIIATLYGLYYREYRKPVFRIHNFSCTYIFVTKLRKYDHFRILAAYERIVMFRQRIQWFTGTRCSGEYVLNGRTGTRFREIIRSERPTLEHGSVV